MPDHTGRLLADGFHGIRVQVDTVDQQPAHTVQGAPGDLGVAQGIKIRIGKSLLFPLPGLFQVETKSAVGLLFQGVGDLGRFPQVAAEHQVVVLGVVDRELQVVPHKLVQPGLGQLAALQGEHSDETAEAFLGDGAQQFLLVLEVVIGGRAGNAHLRCQPAHG